MDRGKAIIMPVRRDGVKNRVPTALSACEGAFCLVILGKAGAKDNSSAFLKKSGG